MAAPKYGKRWPTYAQQWDEMQRTRLTAEREAAQKLFANKARYQAVEAKTGVPWYWIACVHWRESDANFSTQLAQGDPLGEVSTNVPAGLGPYHGADAWERAAIEGLEHDHITDVVDPNVLEKLIYHWESWNGWGSYGMGLPSNYVWAGSSIQKPGRWVSDHHWDANELDEQLGCAPTLKCLMELDPTIKPVRETPMGVPAPQPSSEPPPMPVPAPIPAPSPQLDPAAVTALLNLASQLLQKKLQEAQTPEKQANMTAALTALLTWFISVLPQISTIGLALAQSLISSGVMGSAIGSGATATGQTVVSGLVSTLGVGVLNWIKDALTTKKGTQP